MGWHTYPRPSFGLVFFWIAAGPAWLPRKSFPPATPEIWHFASWLQPVSCCPCWALPITCCLPGCLPWPGDAGWEPSPVPHPAQLPKAAGRAGSPLPLLLLQQRILTNGTRKERADHKARQQQRGRETVFRSLANKNISNSRLDMVKQAGRPGMWLKVN